MSQSRVFSRHDPLPDTGGTLSSSLTIAMLTAAVGWLLVLEAGWQMQHLITSMIGFFVLASIVNFLWITRQGGDRFGEANQATLLRAGLVCLIGSTLIVGGHEPQIGWHLAGVIGMALLLDAIDGLLARRLGLASSFGARFDMEIDALLLLILSLLVWRTGQTGAWVLAIGLMRYAFVATSWYAKPLAGPLAPSFRRKSICALQGIALLTCLLPPLNHTEASAIALIALLALALSFAIDIRALVSSGGAVEDINERPSS